jgi:hypothetical protein
MKRIALGDAGAGLDPRNRFGIPWVAAFLSVVLIISAVFWAMRSLA